MTAPSTSGRIVIFGFGCGGNTNDNTHTLLLLLLLDPATPKSFVLQYTFFLYTIVLGVHLSLTHTHAVAGFSNVSFNSVSFLSTKSESCTHIAF
jgi:hypothetical protein